MALPSPGVQEEGRGGHHLGCGCADPHKLALLISEPERELRTKSKPMHERGQGNQPRKENMTYLF